MEAPGRAVRISAAMCAAGRSLADPRLSPDGATVAFVTASAAGAAVVLVPSGGGPETVLPGPAPARRGGLDWLPAGDGIVLAGADGRLWNQPVDGGPAVSLCEAHGAAAPAVSPDGAEVACTFDGRHVALVSTDESGPWPRRLSSHPDFCVDPAWSPDGAAVAWHEWDVPAMAWDDSRIAWAAARPVVSGGSSGGSSDRSAASGGDVGVVPTPLPAAVAQPRFAVDGTLGFLCDATGWLTLWSGRPGGPVAPLVDDRSEHGGPTWGPGERTWTWSDDGAAVAYTRNVEGFGELCVLERATGARAVVDRGVFAGLSWRNGRLAAQRSGARTPHQVVVYPEPLAALGDAGAGVGPGVRDDGVQDDGVRARPRRTTVARGPVAGFESAGLVEPEVVHWDGAEVDGIGSVVHGRLWRRSDDPGPLVVWIHGGPTGQHRVSFDPRAAFLLDRGYALLQVDPRGTTGWGRAYAQALTGRWGRLDVDDTVAGIAAAVDRGWADADRIAVMGASSAGLVVLSVLARHPRLCAAGIDLYGVTDLRALDETTHRFEAHYNARMLGALPDAAAEWHDRSPITHVGRIVDPLLVLYGSADPVVAPEQSERLVAALASRGAPVEHHCYDGEGHGWSRPATVADELSRIDAFLTRHVLRGRRS